MVDFSDRIDIKDGRHLALLRKMLSDSLFIPNDTLLDSKENRVAIITGPNMAGKSTYMRQVALITIMAQIGSYVPASSAHIGGQTACLPVSARRMIWRAVNPPSWWR